MIRVKLCKYASLLYRGWDNIIKGEGFLNGLGDKVDQQEMAETIIYRRNSQRRT